MFPGGVEEGVEGGELFDGIRRFLGERYVVCERYVVAGEQIDSCSVCKKECEQVLFRSMRETQADLARSVISRDIFGTQL